MPVQFNDLIPTDVKEKVNQRNKELAQEAGNRRAELFSRPLINHVKSGLLAKGVLESMARSESRDAYTEHYRTRLEGKVNDRTSIGLGFTALVSAAAPHLVKYLRESMNVTDEPSFDSAQLLEVEDIDGKYSPLVALRAPQGVYESKDDGMRFTAKSQMVGDLPLIPTRHDVSLASVYIVKVVGDSGELWTNPKPSNTMSRALFEATVESF